MTDYHDVNKTDNRWEKWDAREREEMYGQRNYSGNWGGAGAGGGSYGGGYSGGSYRGGKGKSHKGLVAAIVIPLVLVVSLIVLAPLFSTTEQPKDDAASTSDIDKSECSPPQCYSYTVPAPQPVTPLPTLNLTIPKIQPPPPPEPVSVPVIRYVQPPPAQLVTKEIVEPSSNHDELVNYALELINKDREANGLRPVKLSDNQAAQLHAEDNLRESTVSHWMSNGEKPYMTYTRLGGTGDIWQNVEGSSYPDIEGCKSGRYSCPPTNPMDDIKRGESSMVFDDYACCQNGHRDNILAPEHTHVSIGIAYDDYSFYMVQNFENNYIDFNHQINDGDDSFIVLSGDFEGKVTQVLVSYDELPTPSLYQLHKDDSYYMVGDYIAGVVGSRNEYYDSYQTIYARSWGESADWFNMRFDLSSILTKDGVYTVSVFGDSGDYKDIQLATYSFVYKG